MGKVNIDKYMADLQEVALKHIDHKRLKNSEIMFRATEVPHLAPRFRIEMGFVLSGQPVIASTMREKDPKAVGMKLAMYVNELTST